MARASCGARSLSRGIKAAIRAGVRTVDYGSYLDDEAVALLTKSNRRCFYVPTLALRSYLLASSESSSRRKPRAER